MILTLEWTYDLTLSIVIGTNFDFCNAWHGIELSTFVMGTEFDLYNGHRV